MMSADIQQAQERTVDSSQDIMVPNIPELTTNKIRNLPALPHTEQIRATREVKEYHLTAAPAEWELVSGVRVKVWSFNGQIPGPSIRVKEGDLVRVTLENQLSVPTSIHWHGLHVPNSADGVGMLTEPGVAPGETKKYEFIANHAGTFLYHSHVDEIRQVDMGLYGVFIIDPQNPSPLEHDRDYTLVLSGWVVPDSASQNGATSPHAGHGGSGTGGQPSESGKESGQGHQHNYNYWTINGKAYPETPPLKVKNGDKVRIRLINISQDMHPMHLHGHDFRVIALDGHPVEQPQILNTINVAPGQTADIDFIADNPGSWLFHCHILHHVSNNMKEPGGLTVIVQYEDVPAPKHLHH